MATFNEVSDRNHSANQPGSPQATSPSAMQKGQSSQTEQSAQSATPPALTNADWIPLVEYAHKKDISLSTLRRHIKAGKIPYKVDHGRYLLFDDSPAAQNSANASPGSGATSKDFASAKSFGANSNAGFNKTSEDRIFVLQTELQRAREEIAELKTLIAFYEERTHHQRPDV